jgi:hypothetical protein
MAPRANRKGFPRLPLVTCPVALYLATSDSKRSAPAKIINRKPRNLTIAATKVPTELPNIGFRRPFLRYPSAKAPTMLLRTASNGVGCYFGAIATPKRRPPDPTSAAA